MASIWKRGGYWRAAVRRQGYPQQTRTFDSKADAEAWAPSGIVRVSYAEHPTGKPEVNIKINDDVVIATLAELQRVGLRTIYVENHVARQRGLLGMWAAEDIIGEVDPATGKMIEERRTDIVYGWNDAVQGMKLVFEFKRLGRQKKHRDHYLQGQGLGRFVTGIYSRKQAVAAMVGVLLDPELEVVPPIRAALEQADLATALRLCKTETGLAYARPSTLFAHADFDTEHELSLIHI